MAALGERPARRSWNSSIGRCEKTPEADGIVISCGGLKTLELARPLEARHGLPVVSSTPAALWSAVRLVGHTGQVDGYGQLFE